MEKYYRSIESAFLDKDKYRAITPSKEVRATKWAMTLSFFPLIPVVVFFLWEPKGAISLQNLKMVFIPIWMGCALLSSFRFFYVRKKDDARTRKEYRDRFLSTEQERFATCYALCAELQSYSQSGIRKQLEQAADLFYKLLCQMFVLLRSGPRIYDFKQTLLFWLMEYRFHPEKRPKLVLDLPRVNYFCDLDTWDRLGWFQVDPSAMHIVKGFRKLPEMYARTLDDREVARVADALGPLAVYLYSLIPSSTRSEHENLLLHNHGEQALRAFAETAYGFSHYEPLGPNRAQPLGEKLTAILEWTGNLFISESNLVRGAAWWTITMAVTIIGVLAFKLFFRTTSEGIAVAVVTTPIMAAVTAVAAEVVRKSKRR